jgi:hypothetical protein
VEVACTIVVAFLGLAIGVAGPIGVAQMLHGERLRWWMIATGLAVLLFCGLMFANNAPRGLPFLNRPIAPMVCPCGYENLGAQGSLERWSIPSYAATLTRTLTCTGPKGAYRPSTGLYVLSGMMLYMVFGALYVVLMLLVAKVKRLRPQPVVAHLVAAAVVVVLAGASVARPGLLASLTGAVNALYYSGQR